MSPRPENGELQRAILDQARRLLVADGVSSLSMRRLGAEVGVSPTTIYLYYTDKNALIHALIEEGMAKLGAELTSAQASAELPVKRIEQMCRRYVEFGLSNPEYYEIMFLLHPQSMERYPQGKYRTARMNLDLLVHELAAADEVPVSDEHSLRASVMWSTLHGSISLMLGSRFDASLPATQLVDATVSLAVSAGCRPQPARTSDGWPH
jgi:AcrR family transcriptional regulator